MNTKNIDKRTAITRVLIWILRLSALVGTLSLCLTIDSGSDLKTVVITVALGGAYWFICVRSFTQVWKHRWYHYATWLLGGIVFITLGVFSWQSRTAELALTVSLLESYWAFSIVFGKLRKDK